MSFADNPYQAPQYTFAAQAAVNERADFITKTYIHLAGAIGLFVALEAVLFSIPGFKERTLDLMLGTQYSWLIVLGIFMAVSWVANSWASSAVSVPTQYMAWGCTW